MTHKNYLENVMKLAEAVYKELRHKGEPAWGKLSENLQNEIIGMCVRKLLREDPDENTDA